MIRAKKGKGYRFMVWVSSIGLIAAFYAWVAVAAAPSTTGSTDSTTVVPTGAASNLIDPAVQTMLEQRNTDIQNQQNTAIQADMYNPTTLSPADTLVVQHLSGYCASGVEAGNCSSDSSRMFGDMKASNILQDSSYDDAGKAAAKAVVQTLLTPLDNSAVSSFQSYQINADMLSKNPTLKQQYVQALSDETLLSFVREVFGGMIAKRTPPTGSQGAEAMPSEMALMEQEALKRWMNNSWETNLAQLSPAQMQQEQLRMQVSQLYMEHQRYLQMERVEALLAVSVLQNYRSQKNANTLINKTSTTPDASSLSTDTSTSDDSNPQ